MSSDSAIAVSQVNHSVADHLPRPASPLCRTFNNVRLSPRCESIYSRPVQSLERSTLYRGRRRGGGTMRSRFPKQTLSRCVSPLDRLAPRCALSCAFAAHDCVRISLQRRRTTLESERAKEKLFSLFLSLLSSDRPPRLPPLTQSWSPHPLPPDSVLSAKHGRKNERRKSKKKRG